MEVNSLRKRGFTIVELLIVVVVIAILAAITIVAYNGIQNRAKASALQAAASQAAKKIAVAAVDAGDLYPASKADFLLASNLTDSASQTYDYYVSDDRRNFCVSVTDEAGNSQASTNSVAREGRCVQNLVINPSAESTTTGMGTASGQGGVSSASTNVPTPLSGQSALRMTWTTAPTSATTGGLWAVANSASGLGAGGKTYTASGYIRNSWAGGGFKLNLVGRSSASAVTGEVYGQEVTIPSGTWRRVSVTWTAPANTDFFEVRVRQSGGTLPSVGSTMDTDGFMLTEGSTLYAYGGAETSGWSTKTSGATGISFGPAARE